VTLGERLAREGLSPPPAFAPVASYVGAVRTGSQLHVSGMGPTEGPKIVEAGKISGAADLDQARRAARLTALNVLAQVDPAMRVVPLKVFALVNCAPDFACLDQAVPPARAVRPAVRPSRRVDRRGRTLPALRHLDRDGGDFRAGRMSGADYPPIRAR
jgi:hypothetical protein